MADTNTMHTLNTRIKLKYDSYQNWYDKNPVLMAGEVAVATIESTQADTGFHNLPNVAIKVGDGTSAYRLLPFVTALAGDVHEWAKKDLESFHADELEWIKGNNDLNKWVTDLVGETIEDTNTQYKLVYDATAPYTIKLMANDGKPGSTEYNVEAAVIDLSEIDDRLKAVETALGEGGSVDTRIQDAIDGLTLEDPLTTGTGKVIDTITQEVGLVQITTRDLEIADVKNLQSELDGLQDGIDSLSESKQDKLDIDGVPSATNKVLTQESFGQLDNTAVEAAVAKEFVVAVKQTAGAVSVERRALTADDIPALAMDKITGLDTALAGKQDELIIDGVVSEDNKVATQDTVIKAVAGLEGAMHFRGRVTGDTLDAAVAASGIEDWANGDVVLWGEYEYVWDGSEWLELGNTGLHYLKSEAEAYHQALEAEIDAELAKKQDVVPFENTPSETDKAATLKSIEDRINEHMANINYDGGDFGASKFVTKVVETEGVLTVSYAQPAVADIAGLNGEIERIDQAIEDAVSDLDEAKQDKLNIDGTPSEENPVATLKTVNDALAATSNEDAAEEGKFVVAVSTVDGRAVPTKANVTTDHIQQGNLLFVLDCGGAEF